MPELASRRTDAGFQEHHLDIALSAIREALDSPKTALSDSICLAMILLTSTAVSYAHQRLNQVGNFAN